MLCQEPTASIMRWNVLDSRQENVSFFWPKTILQFQAQLENYRRRLFLWPRARKNQRHSLWSSSSLTNFDLVKEGKWVPFTQLYVTQLQTSFQVQAESWSKKSPSIQTFKLSFTLINIKCKLYTYKIKCCHGYSINPIIRY